MTETEVKDHIMQLVALLASMLSPEEAEGWFDVVTLDIVELRPAKD